MNLDELGLTEVIELYKQKNQYSKEGDLVALIQLKNSFPELFNKQKEREVIELVDTMSYIQETPHFKLMREKEQKKKYIPINYHDWQVGRLEQVIAKCPQVNLSNMDVAAREMVKEAIIGCQDILCSQESSSIPINCVFPYLGYLLSILICQFPVEKRRHKLMLTMFKLSGKEWETSETTSSEYSDRLFSVKEQTIEGYFYSLIQMVTQKFDQRKDYYSDAMFFCLMEAAEFIGLLIPHMGLDMNCEVSDVIDKIYRHIHIA